MNSVIETILTRKSIRKFTKETVTKETTELLLAAHSLGLGATWTGINNQDLMAIQFFRQILNIPSQYVPYAMVPIGYPAEQRPSTNHYDEKKVLWV